MCGIVGLLDPRRHRARADLEHVAGRMASALVQRGPDAHGLWTDESVGVAFGHRRLSVVDLSSHGAQPMVSSSGRYVLTYNGEIYNRVDLAARLRSTGVELRGHSDTEVLLESIATWGLRPSLELIDGMFAFGIWDRQDQRLSLVRDRMGEKPLYWGRLGNGEIVFASTLDALRRHDAFDRNVDRDALALYFHYKYVPAPWSIYEGVFKLEPGHVVSISGKGAVEGPSAYWSLFDLLDRGSAFSGSPLDAVDELEHLVQKSVGERRVADVPVGAFLSGGIDSSVVVAAAQAASAEPLRTFTIGSSSADLDESDNARAVARHLGTHHTELMVSDAEALAVAERIGSLFDEPFGDSSQIPTTIVSELARRDVTVALSGDGGDELFLGYNRYTWVPAIWSRADALPLQARRHLASIGRRVPPTWWDLASRSIPERRRPRMLGVKASKALGVLDSSSAHEVFQRLTTHWEESTSLVVGARSLATIHDDPARWPPTDDIVQHMAGIDAVTYLPDDILCKVDRATMSVGLEGRIPLLSRDIVEFAVSLPVSTRLHEGRPKWVLRELLARSVPRELFERPKAGFGVPLDEWLRGPLRTWASERISEEALGDYVDMSRVETAWELHQRGRANNAYKIWDVVMFSEWLTRTGSS